MGGHGVRSGGRAAVVAGVLLAGVATLACAGRFGRTGPPDLRLSTSPDVRWETGGSHELAAILENAGGAPLSLPPPSPAHARVAIFEAGGAAPVCRHEPDPAAAPAGVVDLAAHERRALVVRIDGCDLAPGEYRYEAWYLVPEIPGVRGAERVGPERGRILVQRAGAVVEQPASRRSVSPPEHADVPAPATPAPAAPANPHFRPEAPPLGMASLSCVDRELARRGLNAWGDPAATVYPEGPPTLASDVERMKMIFERYPDVETLCRIPP